MRFRVWALTWGSADSQGDIQGVVPLLIEGQLLDRLGVGQVVHLLEQQDPQDGGQILGGTAEVGPKARGQLPHRQHREDFPAEQAGPGVLQ